MSKLTFVAMNDLTLETNLGKISYKKGSTIFLEHDSKENVFISYHECEGDKVNCFEIDIAARDILEAVLNSVVIAEKELDSNVSFKEMTLDRLILDEGFGLNELCCYLTGTSIKKKSIVESNGNFGISVPVRNRVSTLSARQKASFKMQSTPALRNESAKRARVTSVSISNHDKSPYIIDKGYMMNEQVSFIKKEAVKLLQSVLGEAIKIVPTSDDTLKVRLLKAECKEVKEALDTVNVNYELTESDSILVIEFVVPMVDAVVKSYYDESDDEDEDDEDEGEEKGKKEEMDDKEDKDDDEDDSEEDDKKDGEKEKEKKEAEGKAREGDTERNKDINKRNKDFQWSKEDKWDREVSKKKEAEKDDEEDAKTINNDKVHIDFEPGNKSDVTISNDNDGEEDDKEGEKKEGCGKAKKEDEGKGDEEDDGEMKGDK